MDRHKPKLLVLTTTFPRWKNDTDPPFVYELSKRLTSSFDVTVHAPHYPGASVKEQMDGIHVHRFRYFFAPFERLAGGRGIVPKLRKNKIYIFLLPLFLASQLCSLIWLVYNKHPDIIHAHWLIPQGLWAIVLKKLFNIPVIITAHGADVFALRSPLVIALKKQVVKEADTVLTVSEALAEVLSSDTRSYEQPSIIPMGVDSSLFTPEMRNEVIRKRYGIYGPFLLFVGRLTEKKGVSNLVDAMTTVTKNVPEAKLLIVGSGELEHHLRLRVCQRGLENAIIFAGGVPNKELPSYYATADIFIGPSVKAEGGDSEGFGLTFVEAVMSGCLVIGTNVGGIEDIITDEKTGFLVPAGDVKFLAEKIIHTTKSIESYTGLRIRARELVIRKYDWRRIADQYKKALNMALLK
ncbi:glycosyltransferase [Desulfobulbus rhabdoformis]|uniref:glycosyltransferase n=1 Tax=Desulfobulbus rhabdoformis TaxID=34032 RepID=UPI001964FE77|nr:glycosyltransferase [Desulfobulbus rhabdoformis]